MGGGGSAGREGRELRLTGYGTLEGEARSWWWREWTVEANSGEAMDGVAWISGGIGAR